MIFFIVAAIFLIVGVYAVLSGIKYTRMISNIFMGLVYRGNLEENYEGHGEKISILESSDREIPGLFLKSNRESSKVVIFCHESGSSKESWEKYAYFFPRAGYHVLSVDFPGQDQKEGENSLTQWPDENEVLRLLSAIRWAKKVAPAPVKIVLFGVSKGANIALAASFKDPAVCAVVADGLFSMKQIFRDYIFRWAPVLVRPNLFGEKYPYWVVNIFANLGYWHCQKTAKRKFIDVESLLRQKHVPLLAIHGSSDDYVSKDHQKFLHSAIKNRTSAHLIFEGAGHNEAIIKSPIEYEDRVKQFLEKCV